MTSPSVPPQQSPFTMRHRAGRALWSVVWCLLFRPSPEFLHGWRRLLLRAFGATLDGTARVYPTCRVWAPWNLTMANHACLGRHVDCYNVESIVIGSRSTVSQYTYLCGATHDFTRRDYPLLPGPITVGDDCWIAADVFVGPGVRIGEGTVVGARASVFKDLPPWVVAVGNPARPIKPRTLEGRNPAGTLPNN
ncbi:MAG: putative colanic acid biosynthesis acetyltransferase [Phycisphaerales bacterium]